MSGIGFTDEVKRDAVAQVWIEDIQLRRFQSDWGSGG